MIVNEENTHHDPKTLSILNSVQLSRMVTVWVSEGVDTHTAHRAPLRARLARRGAGPRARPRRRAPLRSRSHRASLSTLDSLTARARRARTPPPAPRAPAVAAGRPRRELEQAHTDTRRHDTGHSSRARSV